METSLTTWEAKERAGLLALETEEWRNIRLQAEEPSATAAILEHFAFEIERSLQWRGNPGALTFDEAGFHLLIEALAAHPNTPPALLLSFFKRESLLFVYGLCRNPITPLLVLEIPDFWERAYSGENSHLLEVLLSLETAPPTLVRTLKRHTEEAVVQTARLHISISGEIQTRSEGVMALTNFWRAYCSKKSRKPEWQEHLDWIAEFVRFGLVPSWALGCSPFDVPANEPIGSCADAPMELIKAADVQELIKTADIVMGKPPFVSLLSYLNGSCEFSPLTVYNAGQSSNWMNRLNAVFVLPLNEYPIPNDKWGQSGDRWDRSPLDLMHYLAHDGNRFVRWVAQTRLADPDFVFTWHEENGKA